MTTCLIIEDDEVLSGTLARYLQSYGYQCRLASSGTTGLGILVLYPIDVLICDWNLPDVDGLEVCRKARELQSLRIIMLSGRTTVKDVVHALDHGVDDYLRKPFFMRELHARIENLTSTAETDAKEFSSDSNEWIVKEDERVLVWNHRSVSFTQTEFLILACLIKHMGHVVPTDELESRITSVHHKHSSTLPFHIKKIREKLGDVGVRDIIQNVHGVGYRLDHPDKKMSM